MNMNPTWDGRRWIPHLLGGWLALTLLWPLSRALTRRLYDQPIAFGEIVVESMILHGIGILLLPGVLLLAERMPLSRRPALSLLGHLCGAAAFVVLWSSLLVLSYRTFDLPGLPMLPETRSLGWLVTSVVAGTVYYSVLLYAVVVAAHHAIRSLQQAREREVRAVQLESKLAQAELEVLRTQLQPHFLFNSLHGISALMAKDVAGARRMIAVLSDLLRRSLENSQMQEVRLEEELAFLDRFVELQRMRFGERLEVAYRIDEGVRQAMVPRLLLQPLVENALRHGFARRVGAGRVEVLAEAYEGRLHLVVADDGPGLPPGQTVPAHEGIGIGNTRARLRQLYGEEQSLEFERPTGGGLKVHLWLPLRPSHTPDIHLVPESIREATV
jgi:two-component system, LytTR family, sensor kinase